jgi:hypothetical protein
MLEGATNVVLRQLFESLGRQASKAGSRSALSQDRDGLSSAPSSSWTRVLKQMLMKLGRRK